MVTTHRWIVRAVTIALIGLVLPLLGAGAASAAPADEMLASVNGARSSQGLRALVRTTDLDAVAQAWSVSMARSGTLAHNARYTSQVSGWQRIGENVGTGDSIASIHQALLDSPGHRANLLSSGYSQVGLGVASASGRLWVTQVFRLPTAGAAPAPVTPPATGAPAGVTAKDWDGDRRADVLAVDSSSRLVLYAGTGAGAMRSGRQVGSGWGGMSMVTQVGDVTGDSRSDLVARNNETGALWLYSGDGRGGFSAARSLGSGWGAMDALLGVGDWNSDGRNDMLARQRATGALLLYAGDGRGGWAAARAIGHGWSSMDMLTATGDLTGDRRADLVARRPSTGELVLYASSGTGTFAASRAVGSGWSGMNTLYGPGQWDGSAGGDLLARRSDGVLFAYGTDGRGAFTGVRSVGQGWAPMRLVP